MNRKLLITGNLGYVGPVLVKFLRRNYEGIEIIGFDTGFFAHCLTDYSKFPETELDKQIFGDIRNFPEDELKNIDTVIHLSAVSNDPMGNEFEKPTDQINFQASLNLALLAKKYKVKNFIFASSCSIYGLADGPPKTEKDLLNPLTAYARSKVNTEKKLFELSKENNNETNFTSLRFSTACGMSQRLRLDLVLNDFVACAIASKNISILSDGTPWRPIIDVEDMARAITWSFSKEREKLIKKYVEVNVGSNDRNFQVKKLAQTVSEVIDDVRVIFNDNAPPDKRSYRVDFSLYEKIAPSFQPAVSLEESIKRIFDGLTNINFKDEDFRKSNYMRLVTLRRHINENRINKDLHWK